MKILIILTLCLLISGCKVTDDPKNINVERVEVVKKEKPKPSRFVTTKHQTSYEHIFVLEDKETGKEYIYRYGDGTLIQSK